MNRYIFHINMCVSIQAVCKILQNKFEEKNFNICTEKQCTSSYSLHQKEEEKFVCMFVFKDVDVCKHSIYTYMIQLFCFLMSDIIPMIQYTKKLHTHKKDCSVYSRGNNKIRYTYNSGLELYKDCKISVLSVIF